MTRDGTYLIEDGKIQQPLRNLRFTQSILEALNHVDMLSSTLKLCKLPFGPFAVCAPAARIQGFTFTGTTEF
jgi:predicted Zn-dependent protease